MDSRETKGAPSKLGGVLEEAMCLIHGDRRDSYGDPLHSFTKIAQMWSVIFNTHVSPGQVTLAMVAFKVCREVNKHSADNLIDIAGYAALADYIHQCDQQIDDLCE